MFYKTYITTHGASSEGEPAQKKRQRLDGDGRNFSIEIPRSKIIGEYHAHMGWVDRHNRFTSREDILGLHNIWKTKRWKTRMQIEILPGDGPSSCFPHRTQILAALETSRRFRICFLPFPV
jgi:hypothetical protein